MRHPAQSAVFHRVPTGAHSGAPQLCPSSSIFALACSPVRTACPSRGTHRHRGREVLLRLLPLARAPVALAEAEVAVGDEGAHAARLGERQGPSVGSFAALGIEPIGMGFNIAKQMQRPGLVAALASCEGHLTGSGDPVASVLKSTAHEVTLT